jgi:hypothetical protein
MADDAYTRYDQLLEKYGVEKYKWNEDPVKQVELLKKQSVFTVVVLLLSNHTTRLQDGAIKVRFVENFSVVVKEETTPQKLFRDLIGQTLSIQQDSIGHEQITYRSIPSSGGTASNPEANQAAKEFLADPEALLPADLTDQVSAALKKKAKSINKRLRNYDNEKARRDRGRKSRAITSLTKVLAELDPEFRELCVRAVRHNHTTTSQYGYKEHSLQHLLNAINTICSGNNLENWQDEDVIPEAERLASVAWVMNQ